MRITNSVMTGTLLRNLNKNSEIINKYQEELSSGRRINRPSDDPVGIVYALRYRGNLEEISKYKSNAEDAKSWLDTTDSALSESGDILNRLRELVVQASNGASPQEARDAINQEVSQLSQQLNQIANTTYAGRYIFSGTNTLTPAFDATNTFQGNTKSLNYEVGVGTKIATNVDGTQAFGNIFSIMSTLQTNLSTGNIAGISGSLTQIDSSINQQLSTRSEVGARINRIDLAINRMDDQNTNITDLLSKTEDADTTEVITQLKTQENIYQASLATGARIIQPSLVDYLK